MLRPIIVRVQRLSTNVNRRYCRFLIALLMGIWLTVGGVALSQETHLQDGGSISVSQQVEAGRAAYAEQDFEEAIALWYQALQRYNEQADPRHQAMVLTYLSLAHQHLNQWPLAQDTVQDSLRLLNYHDSDDIDAIIRASRSPFLLAQALNAQGRLHLALGQAQRAAISWQQAADIYGDLDDRDGEMGSRVNQVEAIATLGHYRQACRLLVNTLAGTGNCDTTTDAEFNALLATVHQSSDPSIHLLGLRTLGNLLRVIGDVDRSRQVLQEGLALTQSLSSVSDHSSIEHSLLLGLGETEKAAFQRHIDRLDRTFQPRRQTPQTIEQVREQGAIALNYYRQAAHLSTATDVDQGEIPFIQQLTQRQAQAQSLQLLLDLRDWLQAQHQDITQETESIQTILRAVWPMVDKGHLNEGRLADHYAGQWSTIPPSHISIYTQLNIAQSLMRVESDPSHRVSPQQRSDQKWLGQDWSDWAIGLVQQAVQDAAHIQDKRAHSYSLGILGHLWEEQQQWDQAQTLTQEALRLAHQLRAGDLSYQWQWQLGRLHTAQHQWQEAIKPYTAAFATLQSIRNDLVFLNPDVQFSFQDKVEPVYRELVDVLLRPESSSTLAFEPPPKSQNFLRRLRFTSTKQPNDALLQKARQVMDALQVAEVENFLGQACVEQELSVIDQVVDKADPTAALIYTIVLGDRLDVILKLPQRDRLFFHSVSISQDDVDTTVAQLFLLLQEKLPSDSQLAQQRQQSQQLYDWLIAPFADALADQKIQTLVFVLDGPLQTIPMAALFDGDRYLIESYSIATAPGLQLVNPAPLEGRSLDALLAGWINSPPNSSLPGLPGVATELNAIQQTLDRTDTLTDQAFTRMALETQINRRAVPIVHLATHGQFSSQSDQTFIATGDGDRLTLDQLGLLLRSRDETRPNPIQLLFLSACQTLTGDKRAALGMAGLAVRSGARSTIASLWQADDEATAQLVAHFYWALTIGHENGNGDLVFSDSDTSRPNTPLSKAAALQAAQLDLLYNTRLRYPIYWAPFVLLGDWL